MNDLFFRMNQLMSTNNVYIFNKMSLKSNLEFTQSTFCTTSVGNLSHNLIASGKKENWKTCV